jgi:hypothetical protein
LKILPKVSWTTVMFLDIGRRREVIGVDVGLDQPFDAEPVLLDEGDDPVRVLVGDAAGGVVDVHDGIDDGAGVGLRILHDVADGVRRRVEKGGDLWEDGHVDGAGHGVSFSGVGRVPAVKDGAGGERDTDETGGHEFHWLRLRSLGGRRIRWRSTPPVKLHIAALKVTNPAPESATAFEHRAGTSPPIARAWRALR